MVCLIELWVIYTIFGCLWAVWTPELPDHPDGNNRPLEIPLWPPRSP